MIKIMGIFLLIGFSSVCAGFSEGLILFKLHNPQGAGTIELKISKNATRTKMNITQMQMNVEMDMLVKHDNPNIVFQINDKNKSFSKMDLSKYQQQASDKKGLEDFKIKKLGTENILGYKSEHVLLEKEGQKIEMWVTKEIEVYEILKKIQSANKQATEQIEAFKALEKKGLAGFPMKTITYHNNQKMEMEVVKIEAKTFPASIFTVPENYKETSGMAGMMGQLGSQQNMQAIQEMMQKNMTPEKMEEMKKMMEKMMQQQQKE
ncbi:MAG: DUF4412 domain-containing protein [Fibrobacteria bacterium]|nr:DUF4412 domain-containing protein [Fibrobacteria bacterium]